MLFVHYSSNTCPFRRGRPVWIPHMTPPSRVTSPVPGISVYLYIFLLNSTAAYQGSRDELQKCIYDYFLLHSLNAVNTFLNDHNYPGAGNRRVFLYCMASTGLNKSSQSSSAVSFWKFQIVGIRIFFFYLISTYNCSDYIVK